MSVRIAQLSGGPSVPMRQALSLSLAILLFALTPSVHAAVCVNRFLARTEGPKQVITLLTGKLTYQEAQELAKQHGALSWVDEAGKVIATSVEVKAVRPMPVGCDGKTSGVVLQVSFLATKQPSKHMTVKMADGQTVQFEEQTPGT